MMWFNPQDDRAVFMDKRKETHELKDSSCKSKRILKVDPDLVGDFTDLPFPDSSFALVVFDPPHLVRAGKQSWMTKKYGKLEGDWKEELKLGFLDVSAF